MENLPTAPLEAIVGNQLSSIEFVQDYIQLRFDGPTLTAVTHPQVRIGHAGYRWGDVGYRDMLCARIGQIVQTTWASDMELGVRFADGSCVTISLRPDDDRMAEAAIFTNGLHETWVW